MKKRTILDENYMALEQSIAQALDEAVYFIDDSGFEMAEIMEQHGHIENDKTMLNEAEFINFVHDTRVEEILETYVIQKNIAESVKLLRDKREFTLFEAALLSVTLGQYSLLEWEDEVERMSLFFGGKDNIEIPDSDDNVFNVVVNEAGIREGYNSFRIMLEKTQQKLDSYNENYKVKDIDGMNKDLHDLARLYEASITLTEDRATRVAKRKAKKDKKKRIKKAEKSAKKRVKAEIAAEENEDLYEKGHGIDSDNKYGKKVKKNMKTIDKYNKKKPEGHKQINDLHIK